MTLPYHRHIGKKPSIEPFSKLQTFNKVTYLDERFMSRGRWDTLNREQWFISLIAGMCMTPLILVDIEKCLSHCIKDTPDWDYFNNLLEQGYKYITCDGWNRNCTSNLWKENKVKLKKGIYEQEQGYQLKITKHSYMKDLDDVQKSIIDTIMVPVTYIEKATRADLGLIFVSVNKLVAQNAMELRQALQTDIAEPIRNLATKLQPYFLIDGLISPQNSNRRVHDEFILDCTMYVQTKFTKNWTAATRDVYYDKELSSMLTSFKVAESIIEKMLKSGSSKKTKGQGDDKKITYSRSFLIKDLRSLFINFMLRVEIETHNSKIVDGVKFDKWVQDQHTALLSDKTGPKFIQYESDGKTERKTFTYKSASRRSPDQVSWSSSLYLDRLSETTDLIIGLDPQRLFTISQRFEMWKNQGGVVGISDAICPITKKKISLSELNDGALWHADHIIPYDKGGKTIIENGQIICAAANRAKSNKIGYDLIAAE